MTFMSHVAAEDILAQIPDFTNWELAQTWLKEGQIWKQDLGLDVQFTSLEWKDIQTASNGCFGLLSSENWRKFVLATFLADLVSYPAASDQVDFSRLVFVMNAYPEGFRIWFVRYGDGAWRPAGYTGWYPMLDTMYETFTDSPEKLKNRMVVPHVQGRDAAALLYLFNFSVHAGFKKSPLSKALMTKVSEDIAKQKARGMACITVSDDGIRIAKRFGMHCRGYITCDDAPEGVFTSESN